MAQLLREQIDAHRCVAWPAGHNGTSVTIGKCTEYGRRMRTSCAMDLHAGIWKIRVIRVQTFAHPRGFGALVGYLTEPSGVNWMSKPVSTSPARPSTW